MSSLLGIVRSTAQKCSSSGSCWLVQEISCVARYLGHLMRGHAIGFCVRSLPWVAPGDLVEDPRRIERHQLKLGLNPHILAHSVLGGRGVRAGFSKDFESVSSAHPLSLPLAPSRSLSLPLPLPPCTCNSQSRGCVGGGDPLFEGHGRQGLNGGQAVDGREGFGFLFPRVPLDSP